MYHKKKKKKYENKYIKNKINDKYFIGKLIIYL